MQHSPIYTTLALILAFSLLSSIAKAQQPSDRIFYSSLNRAVQLGQFDGVASLKEVKAHGDFGLGSQHAMEGELVMLDGIAYKISVDGKAGPMPDTATHPFAAAKFFRAEKTWTINRPLNLEQLQTHLDSIIETSSFAALKITGSFDSIRYKCYYPQQKPYPPIKETPAKFFDSTNIRGTLVGFFTPKSALVLNSPNYHFHFINESRSSGGHVDQLRIKNVTIEIDYADGLEVKLPRREVVKEFDLNK